MSKQSYQSDIVLGRRYRDKITGIEGTADAVSFYRNACERVTVIRVDKDNKPDYQAARR